MRILIVEDERRMARLLERTLQEEGHQPIVALDGREGFSMARDAAFDCILLDVSLPAMDGVAVARGLRECGVRTPILMLTARDTAADTVRGLDSGADDYLTKPFSIEVLMARIRSVSRRGMIPRPACLTTGDLKLDPACRQVRRGGQILPLTPKEYALLELLMRNANRAVSRDSILESVWGFESDVTENAVEVFVRQLRLKVESSGPKLIHTVRGYGYMIQDPEHAGE